MGQRATDIMLAPMPPFDFDKIGYWSEIKLDIIKDYARPYSTILSNQSWCTGHYYIDALAGAGEHFSKTSNKMVPGSPLNALQTASPAIS